MKNDIDLIRKKVLEIRENCLLLKRSIHTDKQLDAQIKVADYILSFIDSLQEESPTVYVITRCEEHSDYVEKVFLDYNKAVDYCGQFEGKEDEYGRDITKIEVTL